MHDFVDADIPEDEELIYSGDESKQESSEDERDSDREEGQISSDDRKSDDEELERCIASRDIQQLKKILRKRTEDCSKLQKEMQAERAKEKKKEKEMRELVTRIQEVTKTRSSLQRSLESTRTTTPSSSPEHKKQKKQQPNGQDRRKVIKHDRERTPKKSANEKREYENTSLSMLQLKQGEKQEYSELVMKALEATDNIMNIKKIRESDEQRTANKSSGRKKGKMIKVKDNSNQEERSDDSNNERCNRAEAVFELLEKFNCDNTPASVNAKTSDCNDTDKIATLLEELIAIKTSNTARNKNKDSEGDNDDTTDTEKI